MLRGWVLDCRSAAPPTKGIDSVLLNRGPGAPSAARQPRKLICKNEICLCFPVCCAVQLSSLCKHCWLHLLSTLLKMSKKPSNKFCFDLVEYLFIFYLYLVKNPFPIHWWTIVSIILCPLTRSLWLLEEKRQRFNAVLNFGNDFSFLFYGLSAAVLLKDPKSPFFSRLSPRQLGCIQKTSIYLKIVLKSSTTTYFY